MTDKKVAALGAKSKAAFMYNGSAHATPLLSLDEAFLMVGMPREGQEELLVGRVVAEALTLWRYGNRYLSHAGTVEAYACHLEWRQHAHN